MNCITLKIKKRGLEDKNKNVDVMFIHAHTDIFEPKEHSITLLDMNTGPLVLSMWTWYHW